MAGQRKQQLAAVPQVKMTPQTRTFLQRTKAVINERFPVLPVREDPPALQVPEADFEQRPVRQLAPLLAELSTLVCRIDVETNGGSSTHMGTSFLVAKDVLLTCRHVVASFGAPGTSRWGFADPATRAMARFGPMPDGQGGRSIRVSEILFAGSASKKDLDYGQCEPEIALLRLAQPVAAKPAIIAAPDWSTDFEDRAEKRACAVISYPANPFTTDHRGRRVFVDTDLDPSLIGLVERQFEPGGDPLFGTLCVSIGSMYLLTVPNDDYRLFASHDCSTLAGSSGGCVVDLTSGRIVGIHCGGKYKTINLFQLFSAALGRIGRRDELREALAKANVPGF